MRPSSFFLTAVSALGLARSCFSSVINQRSYVDYEDVSYSIDVPQNTSSTGSGPIYLRLRAPPGVKWFALGQGSQMTDGNLFIIYSAPDNNITLSTRRATGHVQPQYDSSMHAYLEEGSGIYDGIMTANIRCDNCTTLANGKSAVGNPSSWSWALTYGPPLVSSNVSEMLYQHDWHGSFTLDLAKNAGSNFSNPYYVPLRFAPNLSPYSNPHQVSDTILHKKRIAHGVMTSVAFVLLFPNFALLLYIVPSRRTVAWIHAPLQAFAVLLALAGFGVGVSVSKDLQELGGYHPVIGYVAVGGVVIIQPILGIMQHLHFRKTGTSSLYGVSHRYLGRFLAALGIINGGLGFHYATSKNPDIPPASPIAYGIICGAMFMIYVAVILWRRRKNKLQAAHSMALKCVENKGNLAKMDNSSNSTLVPVPDGAIDASRNKPWER
ncbi:cytochrome and DOMON domain-containing protein [Aspergillus homomorphus CBS 101889]|uniref:Integral membrane protein n=1 Tax=Aspergillus homomorphus (strain CBS 101889) TaxID=1450537 RepID=A0A395HV00_ASPHC|nr:integral membrane protein [Aspergillus homomorphus CBS 101889]RAL11630.1 integral membrane protein [Aspergillus homomorphus CBS 101889]